MAYDHLVMTEDDVNQARRDARRYWLHNLARVPDLYPLIDLWVELPRLGRWLILGVVVLIIMTPGLIGIGIAIFP